MTPDERLDLMRYRHVHLLGIGGVGVSAVARLLNARGLEVSGSDVRESSITLALAAEGVSVVIGHHSGNLAGADLVVVSTAIPESNPELVAAREAGIPVVHRSRILDALMTGQRTIGVTGTNGKGSVSALITWLLDRAGLAPSFAIGAMLLDFGTNARQAAGFHLVTELDESDGSFAHTHPDVLVINNIEADHLNYYKDLEAILRVFSGYLASPDSPTRLHVWSEDANTREVLRRSGRTAVTFGRTEDADWRLSDIRHVGTGSRFHLRGPSGDLGEFSLSLPGEHNVLNAAAALSVALSEGVDPESARQTLHLYRGLENRFTLVPAGDVLVVKDYISHPAGIRSVIAGARAFAQGRIVTVFKPYRFTMIHYLQDEYRDAFKGADLTLITEMYTAGEVPIPGVDTEFLVEKIRSAGSEVLLVPGMDDIVPTLHRLVRKGDTVVFFGGDDLFRLADRLVADLGDAAPGGKEAT